MTCTSWRGVEERIAWMLSHPPGEVGMCARETWQALGGDKTPACPPAWGCPDANAVYDKVKASGRYWTSTPIPRGAVIVWKYGRSGHAALSAGDGKIVTTDPSGKPGGTGIEPLSYPETKWGASANARIWTDQYNSVRFTIGGTTMADAWEYHCSTKPSTTLNVGTSYTRIDCSTWNPKASGVEFAMVYLNCKPKFKSGKTRGALRIRAVRADGDKSSYMDYVLDVDCVDSDGAQLITHVYFEKGNGGATYYELKCIGGLASVAIGTRYRKGAVDV